MPLFELELREGDGPSRVRLSDQPLTVGTTFSVDGDPWWVVSKAAPEDPRAAIRYVCVPAALDSGFSTVDPEGMPATGEQPHAPRTAA